MHFLLRRWKQTLLMVILSMYTAYSAGPFIWVAMMSLRTTPEISSHPYAFPSVFHWEKYIEAWTQSNYSVYFWNSVLVTGIAVLAVTLIGSMAAHCIARYRFPGNRIVLFTIFSTLIFPPQIVMISLFQVLVEYGLFNTRTGLILVYVALQMPLTVYILEGFFSRLPQDLFDAAKMDGYSDFEIFNRGLSRSTGSCSNTSKTAPRILPTRSMDIRARSSTMGPRALRPLQNRMVYR